MDNAGLQPTKTGILMPVDSKKSPNTGGMQKVTVDKMASYGGGYDRVQYRDFSGESYPGAYGYTNIYDIDYWLLRTRSSELFESNLYARGIIRRLVTNIVAKGLYLEAIPNSSILGISEEEAEQWSELTETHFTLWGKQKRCDFNIREDFEELQRSIKLEAYIQGDMLVILRHDDKTGMPQIQVVDGNDVQTPFPMSAANANIEEGVEFDSNDRIVGFHIRQKDGTFKRVAAYGRSSGLLQAFMVYGTDKRRSRVRGIPMLGLILQSLKELDQYRSSETKAAVINAMLAMVVEKEEATLGTNPMGGMAADIDELITGVGSEGETRTLRASKFLPGMIIDELAPGEKIKSHDTSRPNVNYATFEQAVLSAIAWANEIPPEILLQGFNSNYTAAMGSLGEFKLFLDKERSAYASQFHMNVYRRFLYSAVNRDLIDAPGLIEAFQDPSQYYIYEAWCFSDWAGAIKPHVDLNKTAKGYKMLVEEGFITRDRAARDLTGMRFSRVAARRAKENQMMFDGNVEEEQSNQGDENA